MNSLTHTWMVAFSICSSMQHCHITWDIFPDLLPNGKWPQCKIWAVSCRRAWKKSQCWRVLPVKANTSHDCPTTSFQWVIMAMSTEWAQDTGDTVHPVRHTSTTVTSDRWEQQSREGGVRKEWMMDRQTNEESLQQDQRMTGEERDLRLHVPAALNWMQN